MDNPSPTDDAQATLWNGTAGRAWVDAQPLLDQMYKPLETLLTDAVSAAAPQRVLDVGCGSGSTTQAIARQLGADGDCVGVDVSEPMIAAARARVAQDSSPARFVQADAQRHPFEPASYDMIVSRFGVMFFDDPVEAFTNLRHAAREDGLLQCIVWRSAADNPFMTTAERAAAPLLPNLPARRPDEPGQFAFADRNRVRRILEDSGWSAIEFRAVDVDCTFPESQLVYYLSRLGPVGRILHEVDEPTRGHVIELARGAFEPYVHGADVRFTAACWMVSARARHAG